MWKRFLIELELAKCLLLWTLPQSYNLDIWSSWILRVCVKKFLSLKSMLLREAQKNCAAAAAVAAAGGVSGSGNAGPIKKKSTSSTSLYKENGN